MAHTRGLENKPGDRRVSGLAGGDMSAYLLYAVDGTSNANLTLAGATSYGSGTPLVAAKSGQPATLCMNGLHINPTSSSKAYVRLSCICPLPD